MNKSRLIGILLGSFILSIFIIRIPKLFQFLIWLLLLYLGVISSCFFIWQITQFVRYRHYETRIRQQVAPFLSLGMSLRESIEKAFGKMNEALPYKLKPQTISEVAANITSLETAMDAENAIDIYAFFVFRYVFRMTFRPHRIEDEKILYASQTLELIRQNSYFGLKTDSPDEIDKKWPEPDGIRNGILQEVGSVVFYILTDIQDFYNRLKR